ncbi:hypothetical protein ACVWZA_004401 [Sphingomonas sp. UYAg733]
MIRYFTPLLLLYPGPATAQTIQPGTWDIKSTAVDLVIPGTAGFLLRMMKGKSKTEHKCIAPDQARTGISALLVPDPKSRCRVESSQITDGRIAQVMVCPQKEGGTFRVVRQGRYSAAGFTARMTMSGQTPKGASRIVVDQTATRTASACRR